MEEYGTSGATGQLDLPQPPPFVGIHDMLPAGGNVPLDVAAMLPADALQLSPPLTAFNTRDLSERSGSSTIHLYRGSRLDAGSLPEGYKPDLRAGGLPKLDLRAPLPKRAVNVVDVRYRRYIPSRKRMDIAPPRFTLAGAARTRARKFARDLSDRAPTLATWTGGAAVGLALVAGGLMWAKATVEGDVAGGYSRLAALGHGEAGSISQAIQDVRFSFRRATLLFAPVALIADNDFYRNSRVDLAGEAISGGRMVADALGQAQGIFDRAKRDLAAAGSWKNVVWTAMLDREKPELEKVVSTLESALAQYDAMDVSAFPDQALVQKFQDARLKLRQAAKWGRFTLDNWKLAMDALGESYPVKLLVLNQNRDELRAGGGFPGSVGVMDLYRGRVTNFELKDVYWFDWRLYPYREPAPEGINRLSDNDGKMVVFALRDANYFPSFLESARKIDFFFQKAGQGSLDAVVGINQGVIVDLLKVTGPVYLQEIGRSIGAEDFSLAMSLLVEARMYAKSSPKDILFRFAEEFAKKMEEQGSWGTYAKIVAKHLGDGDVAAAWLRPEIQAGLVDEIRPVDAWKYDSGDFAYPVFTSYSGNKSDRVMDRTVSLERDPQDPCRRTFTLSQRHLFSPLDEAIVRKWIFDLGIDKTGKDLERLVRIQGNDANRQYLRLVLPPGAKLVKFDGVVARQAADHPKYSVIDWHMETAVGASTTATVTYDTPLALCGKTPTLYRQPGLVADLSVR